MLTLNDDIIDSINEVGEQKRVIHNKFKFNGISLLYPIMYDFKYKMFFPNNKINENCAFLGWYIHYNENNDIIDVLYRGFLLKEFIKFPITLKPFFIQTYIQDKFKLATNNIIENMPRVKKLKRLNLKMITREQAVLLYYSLDQIINYYEILYGYEKAQLLKAQITTTPFYINDNGIIKIYNIQTNELTIPDLESEANFLAYFSFLNKSKNN